MNRATKNVAESARGTVPISSRSAVKKEKRPGLWITAVEGPAHKEFHLTLQPLPGEKPAGMIRRLASALRDCGAIVVWHEAFGPLDLYAETLQLLRREFGDFDWPVMWVAGDEAAKQSISGMHVFAVGKTHVETLRLDGQVIGRVFSDGHVRHCLLGDVRPLKLSASKPDQCRETFKQIERALHEAGMTMANVIRTWFFLDDILSWYESFNAVRNEFYQHPQVCSRLMPASTGIGGRNLVQAAVVAGAWAVQAAEASVAVQEVSSPLQCSPVEYGSAFSRAVLLAGPACRRLLVSGTASILPDGHSAHVGDLDKQIALTMEAVHTILASRGFHFSDVTRATAYFKNLQDAPAFDVWQREHGLDFLPFVAAPADICRQELLFEIELDAIGARQC